MRVKDTTAAAQKFVARAGAAGNDYAQGVKAAGQDWASNTAASSENYAAGVQESIARGAFAKGVQAAGPEKYVRNASEVGAQRYPQGVRAAETDWSKGTQPYLDAMRSMTLAPRRPKGDPANFARVQQVGERLRSIKTGRTN